MQVWDFGGDLNLFCDFGNSIFHGIPRAASPTLLILELCYLVCSQVKDVKPGAAACSLKLLGI